MEQKIKLKGFAPCRDCRKPTRSHDNGNGEVLCQGCWLKLSPEEQKSFMDGKRKDFEWYVGERPGSTPETPVQTEVDKELEKALKETLEGKESGGEFSE